jgi:hypothetical protein
MSYYKLEYEDISSRIFGSLEEAKEYKTIFTSKFKEENPLIQIVHLQDYYERIKNNFFITENGLYSHDCIFRILISTEEDDCYLRIFFKNGSYINTPVFSSAKELKEYCLENNIPYQAGMKSLIKE